MQTVLKELLPAFCMFPYNVVAMRLTCWRFYYELPRDTFKVTGETEWSSDFWTLRAEIMSGFTDFNVIYHRAWDAGVKQPPPVRELGKVGKAGENPGIMWVHGEIPTLLSTKYGLQFIEPPTKIFYLSAVFYGGRRRFDEVTAELPPVAEWDTLASFSAPVPRRIVGSFSDLLKLAECNIPCKLFRRK